MSLLHAKALGWQNEAHLTISKKGTPSPKRDTPFCSLCPLFYFISAKLNSNSLINSSKSEQHRHWFLKSENSNHLLYQEKMLTELNPHLRNQLSVADPSTRLRTPDSAAYFTSASATLSPSRTTVSTCEFSRSETTQYQQS